MAFELKPNSGSLFKNDRKTSDKHPDYTGTWKDADGKEWQLAAWVKEGSKGKFFSLSASEKRAVSGSGKPGVSEHSTMSDDLPF